MNGVYGGYPISDPNATTVDGKIQPYNLIDTNPSCFHQGICNMFPPGGELSAFPNSEEKFQHILHNLHRMHVNESLNSSIGKWYEGNDKSGGLTTFCINGCVYCGTSQSNRRPLYWYSDANQMARFGQWDYRYCDPNWYQQPGENRHSTCKWGNTSIPSWKGFNNGVLSTMYKNTTYLTGTNRCALFGNNPNPTSSPTNPTPYNDDCESRGRSGKFCHDRKDRCWFETEGHCDGNKCLFDPHCEPVYANKYDYVGKGFVAKMNTTSAVYSRYTKEIYYPLPIAAHFDERVKVVEEDREQATGKYFVLMLEYFDYNRTQNVLDCYALYDGNYTSMSIYAGSYGHSAIFSANFVPSTSCEPYSFICKTSVGNFFRLPEEPTYYFGTEWIDWDDIDYKYDFGYDECKENHYYKHLSQGWTVNGGPTLKKSDIWYYQDIVNYGSCIGCQYISILECWEQCIRDDFIPSSCSCVASNTLSPTIQPTTTPTLNANDTLSPTIQPTEAPTNKPTVTSPNPTTTPTLEPIGATLSPTPYPTDEKIYCGINVFCYIVDVYPSLTNEVEHSVLIQNPDDNSDTYFNVFFIIHDNDCISPRISFEHELIDYDAFSEYIDLFDDNDNHLIRCQGGFTCNQFSTCINDYDIGVNKIEASGEHYRIKIVESFSVDSQCLPYHTDSINARLKLTCAAGTANPTIEPTVDPTLEPTAPTLYPTTALPTLSPTFGPGDKVPCGSNKWCFYIPVTPNTQYDTEWNVLIQNQYIGGTRYFDIYFIISDTASCINPRLTFVYERIDYDQSTEYIDVFDNNDGLIGRCGAGVTNLCNNYATCLNKTSLGLTHINANSTYQISLTESSSVNSLCSFSSLSINANATLYCQGNPPTVQPTEIPSTQPTKTSVPTTSVPPTPEPPCSEDIDIIFILDSSGSVYDDGYNNWQQEINAVKRIVNSSLPSYNSRVGLFNFGGCGMNFNFIQCRDQQNRLEKLWGLNDFGNPNDLIAVYDRVDHMGPNDFLGGYTWTDQILMMALNEFKGNSSNNTNKVIVMITDGEPFPYNASHEPCKTSTGYISPTLQSLRDLNVKIISIAVDVTQSAINDSFKCMVDNFDTDFYYADDFDALASISMNFQQYSNCTNDTTTATPTYSPTVDIFDISTTDIFDMTTTIDTDDDCFILSNYQFSIFNGEWYYGGEYDGRPSYIKADGTYYLEWISIWGYNAIHGPPQGSTTIYGYCDEPDIKDCVSGTWYYYHSGSNNGFSLDPDAAIASCSNTSTPTTTTTTTTSAPTNNPVPSPSSNETVPSDLCMWGRLGTEVNSYLNGEWVYIGQYNSRPYYSKYTAPNNCLSIGTQYLWYHPSGHWYITSSIGSLSSIAASCASTGSDPTITCNGKWNIGGNTIDPVVYVTAAPCPAWECDQVITGQSGACNGPFTNAIGWNAWSNAAGTWFWYFHPLQFNWQCNNAFEQTACPSSYYAATDYGWTDLAKGSNASIDFIYPTTSSVVQCIGDGTPTPTLLPSLPQTSSPTENPSVNPTKTPTQNECACSSDICYSVDVIASNHEQTITNTVNITNINDITAKSFGICYNVIGNDCENPRFSFKYERIDYDSLVEFISIYDDNNTLLTNCGGNISNLCGSFDECLSNYYLDIDTIHENSTYQITITQSNFVGALCEDNSIHSTYSMNGGATLQCGTQTNEPTFNPSSKPTDLPTTVPTTVPTSKPTDLPTTNPTTIPTLKPTDLPTTGPTTIPTSKPTDLPTTGPTVVPTKYPTSSPTLNPTLIPTLNPIDPSCKADKCYYQTITEKTSTLTIINSDNPLASLIYVYYTFEEYHCDNPRLTFEYEKVDIDRASEYIEIRANDTFIADCGDTGSNNQCGETEQCFNNIKLNEKGIIDPIYIGQTLKINILVSDTTNALCETDDHEIYTINAKLILKCNQITAAQAASIVGGGADDQSLINDLFSFQSITSIVLWTIILLFFCVLLCVVICFWRKRENKKNMNKNDEDMDITEHIENELEMADAKSVDPEDDDVMYSPVNNNAMIDGHSRIQTGVTMLAEHDVDIEQDEKDDNDDEKQIIKDDIDDNEISHQVDRMRSFASEQEEEMDAMLTAVLKQETVDIDNGINKNIATNRVDVV